MLLCFAVNISKDLVALLQRRAADSERSITATHCTRQAEAETEEAKQCC